MFTGEQLEKLIRRVAIRYIGRDYDSAELEQLLDGSKQPHPVHEEPLIQAFIAGAKWADYIPRLNTLGQALADAKKRQEQAEIEDAQQARKVHPIIRNTLIILAFIALFFAILYLIPSFAYLSFNFLTWDAAIRAAIGLISLFGGIISGFFVIIELDDTFTGKGMRCPAG